MLIRTLTSKGDMTYLAYIYEIVNDVNDKRYIGKTEFDIDKRFTEHCNDAFKERNENRPLYRAMRKYGIEHFHIHLIEETDFPEEREIYWIQQKQTYHHGYNATLGGDGKHYLDYDLIIRTYKEILNISETARICNVSKDSVKSILDANNINIKNRIDVSKEKLQKTVGMYDVNDHSKLIETFSSTGDASKYLINNGITNALKLRGISTHISEVCNNKRKSAYGYFWRYIN
jgi:group I intron endonuclease